MLSNLNYFVNSEIFKDSMNLGYIKESLPNPIFSILKNYKNCEISNDSLNHDEIIMIYYEFILLIFN